jgi:hypothetical protein
MSSGIGRANDLLDARVVDVLHLVEVDLARKDALEQVAKRLHDDRVEDQRAAADPSTGADDDAVALDDLEDADVPVNALLELR